MTEIRPSTDLTPEQQKQLTSLLDELNTLPTAEVIVASRLIRGDLTSTQGIEQIEEAIAGGWAATRVIPYVLQLRMLDQQRLDLGTAIHRHKHHPEPEAEDELVGKARAEVLAISYSGQQEVVYNLFSICVQHIRTFLKMAAESVGYEIPGCDLEFLDEFRHLRNHYEHMRNRLPGKTNQAALITNDLGKDSYRVRGGLETDSQQRMIVKDVKGGVVKTHVVDITSIGMERIERIIQETWAGLKSAAIDRVRDHYVANPLNIPPPEAVPKDLLMSVGGFVPPPEDETDQSEG